MSLWMLTLMVLGHLQGIAKTNAVPIVENKYKYTGVGAFKVHGLAKTWDEARLICQNEGGDLAIVNSAEEAQIISELFNSSLPHTDSNNEKYALIGFHDQDAEGHHMTIEVESLTVAGFNDWLPTEPSDTDNDEDCGSLSVDGKLNDVSCSRRYGFVCEQSVDDQQTSGFEGVYITGTPITVETAGDKDLRIAGSEINITCNVDGTPTPEIVWYKDDTLIQRNKRIENSVANVLIISKLENGDSGKYSCVANNGFRNYASTLDLVVIAPIKVNITMPEVSFPVGSDFSITCNVDGYPSPEVRWYKDDIPVKTSIPAKTCCQPDRLAILQATENDSGKYRCEATNEYASNEQTVDVKVTVPVKVKITVDDGPFANGDKFSLTCNADGYPTPQLLWYKDDDLILTDYRVEISANKLIISDAEMNDAGSYRCEAANPYTSGAHTVDIRVNEKKLIVEEQSVKKGSTLSIECKVEDISDPTFLWYKDDNLILFDKRMKTSANKLIISASDINDAGRYRCEASDGNKQSFYTVDIEVAVPVKAEISMDKGPVSKGSKLRMACNIEGSPTPTLLWYKDNNLMVTENRIKISGNELIISDADTNDSGRYRCEAVNEYATGAHTVDIKVDEKRLPVQEHSLKKGGTLSIECKVDDYQDPTFLWYKDDNLILIDERIKISGNKLIISAPDMNDTGSYRCEASDGNEHSVYTVDINVTVPVKVKISMDKGPVSKGSELRMACNIEGSPTPTLLWYKNDDPIPTDDRIQISGNELIISDADTLDTGSYRCEAANEYTSAAHTIDIEVAEKRPPVEKQSVKKGSTLSIECKVEDYLDPTFLWYKDDNLILIDQRIKISGNKLIISAPDMNDTGSYRCEASDGNKQSVYTVDINVTVPVKVNILMDKGPVNKGNKLSMTCNVEGSPTPTLLWYKDDNLILTDNRIEISGNGLIISDTDINDSGTYRCEAANEHTNGAHTVDINVIVPVKVKISMNKQPVYAGTRFSMACNVEGYPIPTLLWYKDDIVIRVNNKIKISENKLFISGADMNDAGSYRCEAANEYTNGAHTVDIKVDQNEMPVKVQSIIKGRTLTMVCKANGRSDSSLVWYKDDNLITNDKRIRIFANKVIITMADINDAGRYSCRASGGNKHRHVYIVDIKVIAPVKVEISMEKGQIYKGSNLSMACNVKGSPTPTLLWYKDDNPILTDNRIRISGNKLMISYADTNDAGKYLCEAVNQFSSGAHTVDVRVDEKKSPVEQQSVKKGSTLSIECKVEDYPDPTFLWYKDDNLILFDQRIKISGNKLIISSPDMNDGGSYRCEASDGNKQSVYTVDINVTAPVKVKISMDKGPVNKGSQLRMACNIEGSPTPTLLWYKNDDPIPTDDRIQISGNELIISDADTLDTGSYRCEAANEYTSAAHTIDIEVAEKKAPAEEHSVTKGSTLSIACKVVGYPDSTLLWYKDDNLILTDRRINISGKKLIISAADINDAGSYRCEGFDGNKRSVYTVGIKVAVPVKVKIAMAKGPVYKGSTLSMKCNVEGSSTPTLLWYKDDNLVVTDNRIKISGNELMISNADTNDDGSYRCEAANEYTNGAHTVDIKVDEKKLPVEEQSVKKGSALSIECKVEDYPDPTFLWYKDDNLILIDQRIKISGNKLIIAAPDMNDAGSYRCEASDGNKHSVYTVDINVTVPVKVKISMDKGPVSKGSKLRMACNIEGSPTPTLLWYKNDNPIATNDRIQISGNELIISDADTLDTGSYRCEAANEYTSAAHTIDIEVAEKKAPAEEHSVTKGSTLSIACKVVGYPDSTLLWYKDDNLILTDRRINISGKKLIISAADINDAGSYRCEGFDGNKRSVYTVGIKVAVPVKVKIAMAKGPVYKGSTLSMNCNVEGSSTPTLLWYKDDNLIVTDNRIKISGNELIIANADSNDDGSYRCEAANDSTNGAHTIDIIVAVPVNVRIVVDKGPFNKGSRLSMTCHVDGSTTPTLRWYKDDNLIHTDNRITISANKLIISATHINDTGSYRCEAANEYTNGAHTVDIKIAAPVEAKIVVNKGPFHKGTEIDITCNVAGYPIPTVLWYKDDNLIVTNNRIKIAAHQLIISTADEHDTGRYRCEAVNEVGKVGDTVDVVVSDPIKLNIEMDKDSLLIGSKLSLACNASGFPTPKVQWYKNDLPVRTNNGIWYYSLAPLRESTGSKTLMISEATENDSGQYRCEATNKYTSVSHTVDVSVRERIYVNVGVADGTDSGAAKTCSAIESWISVCVPQYGVVNFG